MIITDHSVLLVEARDRIGGRTYTVNKDGGHLQLFPRGTGVDTNMNFP